MYIYIEEFIVKSYRTLIKTQQDFRCGICLERFFSKELEIHHILFRSQGGGENRINLIALCKVCHKKLHKSPEKFLDQVLYYQSQVLPLYYEDYDYVHHKSEYSLRL